MSSAAPNPLPATFLRGGTSKGIFLKRTDLPADQSAWAPIFLGIMGSPDPTHGRQLNGMGGGVSSLSKICVVGPPSPAAPPGTDVEYTFVQVAIRDATVDYSGNCGNLSSMIGVFALDEGMCTAQPETTAQGGKVRVRAFNTNTRKLVDTTFPVTGGSPLVAILDRPESSVAGVPGLASTIVLEFVDPSGARTGTLLPTGRPVDTLAIPAPSLTSDSPHTLPLRASLVDATNPTVFVALADVQRLLPQGAVDAYIRTSEGADVARVLEDVRQSGARAMGLDAAAQAQPKIALLSAGEGDVDVTVHALSMGVLHRAVPMTVGLCLGVAAGIQGSLAWDIVRLALAGRDAVNTDGLIRIRHPSGVVDVGSDVREDGHVRSAKVVRTGRRLMRGVVWW